MLTQLRVAVEGRSREGEWKKTHMESTPQVSRSIFLHVGSLGSKAPSGDVDSGLLAGFLAWDALSIASVLEKMEFCQASG